MSENNDVYELTESAASYAGNLYNGLEKISAGIRENSGEWRAAFAEATEGLEWLVSAVAALNNVGGKVSGFDTETIKGFLSEMLEAFENRDYVLLADLIQYEILPIIDIWGNKLDDTLETKQESK